MSSVPRFKTYWTIRGEVYSDFKEVRRLVAAGETALETSVTQQRIEWLEKQNREQTFRRSLERFAKFMAEAAHKQSPEGKREAAVRLARENPGGIVSGVISPAHVELDQYGPNRTNIFK
jgi:hypothetical protein